MWVRSGHTIRSIERRLMPPCLTPTLRDHHIGHALQVPKHRWVSKTIMSASCNEHGNIPLVSSLAMHAVGTYAGAQVPPPLFGVSVDLPVIHFSMCQEQDSISVYTASVLTALQTHMDERMSENKTWPAVWGQPRIPCVDLRTFASRLHCVGAKKSHKM